MTQIRWDKALLIRIFVDALHPGADPRTASFQRLLKEARVPMTGLQAPRAQAMCSTAASICSPTRRPRWLAATTRSCTLTSGRQAKVEKPSKQLTKPTAFRPSKASSGQCRNAGSAHDGPAKWERLPAPYPILPLPPQPAARHRTSPAPRRAPRPSRAAEVRCHWHESIPCRSHPIRLARH